MTLAQQQEREGRIQQERAHLVTSPGPIRDEKGNVIGWKPFEYVLEWAGK